MLVLEQDRYCGQGVKSAFDSACLKWVAAADFHPYVVRKKLILLQPNRPTSQFEQASCSIVCYTYGVSSKFTPEK